MPFQYKPIYQGEAIQEYDKYIDEAVKTYDQSKATAVGLKKAMATIKAQSLIGHHPYIDKVTQQLDSSLGEIAKDVQGGLRWETALSKTQDLAMTLEGDPILTKIKGDYASYQDAEKERQKQLSAGHQPYTIGDNQNFSDLTRPFFSVVVPKGDWNKEIEDKVALVVPELKEELDLEKSDPAHGVMVWKTSQGNMRANALKSIIKDSFSHSSEFQNMKSIYDSLGKTDTFDKDIDAMVNDALALKTFESVRYDTNRTAVDGSGGGSGKSKKAPDTTLLTPQRLWQDNIKQKDEISEDDFNYEVKSSLKAQDLLQYNGGFETMPNTDPYEKKTTDFTKSTGYKKVRSIYDHLPDGELRRNIQKALDHKDFKTLTALVNPILNKERSLVNYIIPVSGDLAVSPSMKSAIKVGMAENNAGFVNDVKVTSVRDALKQTLIDSGVPKDKAIEKVLNISDSDIAIQGVVFRGTDKENSSIGSVRAVWNGIPFTVPVTGDLKQRLEPFENVMRAAQTTKMGKPSWVEFPIEYQGVPITIKGTLRKYLDKNGEPQVHIEPDLSGYGEKEKEYLIKPMLEQFGGKFSLNDVVNFASFYLQNSEFINGQK